MMEMDTQTIQNKKKKLSNLFLLVFFLVILGGIWFFRANVEDILNLKNITTSQVREFARDISTPGALISKIESASANLTESGVFAETNNERVKAGLKTLKNDVNLSRIAELRLQDMFQKQYFEHVSPSGESASTVASDVQYEYIAIGENIALGNFENDKILVDAWMNSPGHRANILSTKYSALGVAVGKGEYKGKSTWMGVQIFSKPISECPVVSEAKKAGIQNLKNEIDAMKNKLSEIESELEKAKTDKNYNEYNRLVRSYNDLAGQINSYSSRLKILIDNYNADVRTFNACAGF